MKTKKTIHLTESELREVVKNVITEVVSASQLNSDRQFLNEMAKLNMRDGGQSPFPSNAFSIVVQGDNSPHKPAHVHVSNAQEGYSIRVYIENGQLMSVERFGRRNRTDNFNDVLKSLVAWFDMPSTLFKGSTNRQVALTLWEASNPQ